MCKFAIIGNPIFHSQSPHIYNFLYKKIKRRYQFSYKKILSSHEKFQKDINSFFFKNRGIGINVTSPFKESAYALCNKFTDRVFFTKSVNVIRRENNNLLFGDNTDGIGLIYDFWSNRIYKDKLILLIGSGGAAKGVLYTLLYYGYRVSITNRTFSSAKNLFNSYRKIKFFRENLSLVPLKNLKNPIYDVIVNATSSSMNGDMLSLPKSLISTHVICYDLFYTQKRKTIFTEWSKKNGAKKSIDGLGMLINQAIFSFLVWNKIETSMILSDFNKIRSEILLNVFLKCSFK